ncbi:MAG: rhodanese-like domain-containing protein [Candidatus Competibacteraceae bacterium]|nr:rhodanese-like domain-containing protein [Candidatus Competibacteraceae bacterium]
MGEFAEFAVQNWYLFVALVGILGFLAGTEVLHKLRGIAGVNPTQALQLMNDQEAVMLDLRDGGDYKSGHIPAAVNIPFASLESRAGELKKFKGKPVILCCATGTSLSKVGTILKGNGFETIHNLSGGLSAWQTANLPLSKNNAPNSRRALRLHLKGL